MVYISTNYMIVFLLIYNRISTKINIHGLIFSDGLLILEEIRYFKNNPKVPVNVGPIGGANAYPVGAARVMGTFSCESVFSTMPTIVTSLWPFLKSFESEFRREGDFE